MRVRVPLLALFERKRLLHRQTAFVVTGRQVFLPFFGIALRDDFGALARRCLGTTAQAVLLAGLEGQIREPLRDRMVIRLTGCSRASAFRALAELRSFGLVAPTARGLAIVPNAREALRLAEPRLRSSPVCEILLAAVYG